MRRAACSSNKVVELSLNNGMCLTKNDEHEYVGDFFYAFGRCRDAEGERKRRQGKNIN